MGTVNEDLCDNNLSSTTAPDDKPQKKNFMNTFLESYPKWKEAVFLTSVAGMSMLFGFGASVTSSKRQDPEGFDKGFSPSRKFESGTALATRALKWGTFYAVTGVGLVCFTIWKLMGVNDLKEFRMKAGGLLPRIPKNEPQGRTEFANLTDLLQYVIDEDNIAKAEKKKAMQINTRNNDENSPKSLTSRTERESSISVAVNGVSDLHIER